MAMTILIVICILIIIVSVFCYYENNGITVSNYYIDVKLHDNIRIVHLSDLHSKEFGKENKRLYKKVINLTPDLIVITGDLFEPKTNKIDTIINFISKLNKDVPVIYIPGNHELRSGKYGEIYIKLCEAKIQVLNNTIVDLKVKNKDISILGLVEKQWSYNDYIAMKKGKFNYRDYKKIFNKLSNEKGIKILLSHYPENYRLIGEKSYENYNFDVMFAGHAHGGQFRLPFIGGLYAPSQGILPKYTAGIYGNKNKLVISRGLGNSSFPLRLFNRPEIVVVNLK